MLERLESSDPFVSVELRPPPEGLDYRESMEAWIDLYHAVRGLTQEGHHVLLTDNAVGAEEEESLRHLGANLGQDAPRRRLVPFLTCKHTLEYCRLFAERALSQGIEAVIVTGGDRDVGPPRCVERSKDLRAILAEHVPDLVLGGWANPFRDPAKQVEFVVADDFLASFFLTQVVSHHRMDVVETFLEEMDKQGVDVPGVFGVFYYRSGNPTTLRRLANYFPVPAEDLIKEFETGVTPEEVAARTIRELQGLGISNVYLANLPAGGALQRYERIMDAV